MHRGSCHTKEALEKMSLTHKNMTAETRKKMGIGQKKLWEDADYKEKMSNAHKGHKHTEEHKRKISLGCRGYKPSEETKRKISIANTGKIRTKEVRQKISEILKRRDFKPPVRRGSECSLWIDGRSKDKEYQKMRIRAKRTKRRGYGHISVKLIQRVYEDNIKKYGTLTCYLCNESISFGKDSLEHKIPLSRGGTHLYENLAVACRLCNSKKQSKTYNEYIAKKEAPVA